MVALHEGVSYSFWVVTRRDREIGGDCWVGWKGGMLGCGWISDREKEVGVGEKIKDTRRGMRQH